MNKSILSTLTQQLTYLALNRIAVLTDTLRGVEYHRQQKAFGYSESLSDTIDCLIIGKEHYSEENRKVPIQSKGELNKILKLEAANSDDIMLYRIGDYAEGIRQVVCWKIKRQVLAHWQLKPLFILPESALLLSAQPNNLITLQRKDRVFWLIDHQGQYLSAEKKGLISSATLFLASAGISAQVKTTEINALNYLNLLFASSGAVLLQNMVGFNARLRHLSAIDLTPHFKYSGISAALLFTGYFSITSLYLNVRLENAKTETVLYSEKTKDVFEIKDQLNRVENKMQQLSAVTDHISSPSVTWRFIIPLFQRQVKVLSISMLPDGLFILDGEAKKATEVLEFIKSDPMVAEPQFRGQNSVVNGVERFSIGFKIVRGV